MELVTPICICGHRMHVHSGDGCFFVLNRLGPYTPTFCSCKIAGGQYDPEAVEHRLFKPCMKGLHENCAKVNVFDPSERCSCMCHGKD